MAERINVRPEIGVSYPATGLMRASRCSRSRQIKQIAMKLRRVHCSLARVQISNRSDGEARASIGYAAQRQ